MKKQKNHCIWIFGLQRTGKTTTANNLMQNKLRNYISIDGDKFRKSRTIPLDYSRESVLKNNQECLRMIRFLMSEGWDVVVSMVTPLREVRKLIKKELKDNCLIVMLACKKEVREKRGSLELFKNDIIFEDGECDLVLDTDLLSEEEVRDNILKIMQEKEFIQ